MHRRWFLCSFYVVFLLCVCFFFCQKIDLTRVDDDDVVSEHDYVRSLVSETVRLCYNLKLSDENLAVGVQVDGHVVLIAWLLIGLLIGRLNMRMIMGASNT